MRSLTRSLGGYSRHRVSIERAQKVLVASAIILLFDLGSPRPAWPASLCTGHKQIFVRHSSTTARWGVRGKIPTALRTLETQACTGTAITTVHHEDRLTICGTQVEIGIRQYPWSVVIFSEKQTNWEVLFYEEWAVAPTNSWILGRVRGVSQPNGTVDYHMEYNLLDGMGWHGIRIYNVGWATGFPMGETEKFGSGATMNSKHRNLKYVASSNGPEYDWAGMTCVFDDAPGWQWQPLTGSTNDYNVVSGSGDR